jgi:hypothetical protein
MKWVVSTIRHRSFDERTLNFKAEMKQPRESATISFKLNRNERRESLEIPINKKINLDQRSIKLQTLTASPITTVLKARYRTIELGLDYISKKQIQTEKLEMP